MINWCSAFLECPVLKARCTLHILNYKHWNKLYIIHTTQTVHGPGESGVPFDCGDFGGSSKTHKMNCLGYLLHPHNPHTVLNFLSGLSGQSGQSGIFFRKIQLSVVHLWTDLQSCLLVQGSAKINPSKKRPEPQMPHYKKLLNGST